MISGRFDDRSDPSLNNLIAGLAEMLQDCHFYPDYDYRGVVFTEGEAKEKASRYTSILCKSLARLEFDDDCTLLDALSCFAKINRVAPVVLAGEIGPGGQTVSRLEFIPYAFILKLISWVSGKRSVPEQFKLGKVLDSPLKKTPYSLFALPQAIARDGKPQPPLG